MPRGQAVDPPTGIPKGPVGAFRRPPPTSRLAPLRGAAVDHCSGSETTSVRLSFAVKTRPDSSSV